MVSWRNNCNTRFKVHFGNNSDFTEEVAYTYTVENPTDNNGEFSRPLASREWMTIKRLVRNVPGSTLYWYGESWDALGRYGKTEVIPFSLTD
jgi:hypothetical protein